MAEAVRRVYEIDVKLAQDALAALRLIQQNLKDVEKQAGDARGKLKDAFGGSLGFNLAAFGAVKQGFQELTSTIGSFVGISLRIAEVQGSLERLRLGFSSIDPRGLVGAGEQINYVREQSRIMAVDFNVAAQAFLKLSASARGTVLEGQQVREVFEAVSLASRNLGLSNLQTENAFRALEQIISKGVVQQEELRGQLSEAIPGAVQIAARAFGVGTDELNKMIKTGTVFAEDFVPKFASQLRKELGGNVQAGVADAVIAIRTFQTSYQQMLQTITDAGAGKAAADTLTGMSTLFDDIRTSIERTKKEADDWWDVLLNGGRAAVDFLSTIAARTRQVERANIDLALSDSRLSDVRRGGYIARLKALKEFEAEDRKILGLDRPKVDPGATQSNNAALARGVDRNIEIRERDQLARLLNRLRDDYKNLNEERRNELAILEKLRAAGKFVENPEEYNRLREAILKKTEVKNDATRADARATKGIENFITRLEQEIQASRDLANNTELSTKLARERAEAETLLERVSAKKRGGYLAEVDQLLRLRSSTEEYLAKKREQVILEEKEANARQRVIDRTNDAASSDEHAVEIYGKQKEALALLAIAKYEDAKASAMARLEEEQNGQQRKEVISQIEALIAAYDRAIAAKEGLVNRERTDSTDKLIKEADKLEKDSIAKRREGLYEALRESFKGNRNIAKSIREVMIDELERKAFKIIVEPILDPFIKALTQVIDSAAQYLSRAMSQAMRSIDVPSGEGGGVGSIFSTFFSNLLGGGGGFIGMGTPEGLGRGDFGLSGGRAAGGYTAPWSAYRVNEDGMEMASVGGKDFLLMGSQAGSVTPSSQVGGNGGITFNVINKGRPQEVESQSVRQTPEGMMVDVVLREVARDIRKGGRVGKAAQSTFGLNRAAGTPRKN